MFCLLIAVDILFSIIHNAIPIAKRGWTVFTLSVFM